MMTMTERKRALRRDLRARVASIPASAWPDLSARVVSHLLTLPEYRAARTVCCYVGVEGELRTAAFLRQALADGKRVCAPACVRLGVMEMRVLTSLDALQPAAYGLLEPPASAAVLSPGEIDFAVIPCLACTRGGVRLGKGGGFYDRFLAEYGGAAAVLCPEALICDALPVEPHDQPVPLLITEAGIYRSGHPQPLSALRA